MAIHFYCQTFQDSSETIYGTGAGIYRARPVVDSLIPMGTRPSSRDTAILECCRDNLRLKDKSIIIFSDSHAAVRSLTAQEFSSWLVWECYKSIDLF